MNVFACNMYNDVELVRNASGTETLVCHTCLLTDNTYLLTDFIKCYVMLTHLNRGCTT